MKKNQVISKIKSFAPYAELMPAVVIIQQLEPFLPVYMSSRGLKELGITGEELQNMGTDYLANFFNLEDSEDYLHQLRALLQKGDPEETFSFFQEVKFKQNDEWTWHIASTRIFARDEQGKVSHIITVAIPISEMKHIPNKAERLLKEKKFFNVNREKFDTLGKREREILKMVALGKSSTEIAEDLHISTLTVQTHRKSIKQKLNISSSYQFTLYAHAFDLI